MYDHKNHVGRYTEEEVEQLRNLRAIHGNRWGTIGAIMGRSAASVKDRVRVLRDNCNQGESRDRAPAERAARICAYRIPDSGGLNFSSCVRCEMRKSYKRESA